MRLCLEGGSDMRRREMLKAVLAGGAWGLSVSTESAASARYERVTPITGPDHPFAPRKTLVYGLGVTAANIMRKALEDDFLHDDWAMWAGIPDDQSEQEVLRWGTDLYPFSERNMSCLSILARLGDRGADLVAPTILAWRNRVPVEVLLLGPANGAGERIARCQEDTLLVMAGYERVAVGHTEEEALRFLGIRSGLLVEGA